MLLVLGKILFILLMFSITGYIVVVLKQKYLLKNNIVFINKESINEDLLRRANLKYFRLNNVKLKSGDEVRIRTVKNENKEGILIGLAEDEDKVLIVTYKDKVEEYKLKDIVKIKLVSRYGYFF